ncbi:hypothetical protein M422DRAFT_244576 [Sphaerobolus stellatus SS14]|nr:hypothetical protein M422DRAFT_244576 [Sphaerobolus stellatus SS14]
MASSYESQMSDNLFRMVCKNCHSESLQGIMRQQSAGLRSVYQLSKYKSLLLLSQFVEVAPDSNGIYRLYEKGDLSDSPLKVTFEVQGFLLDYRLPIFQRGDHIDGNPLHATQMVQLFACSVSDFTAAAEAVCSVNQLLQSSCNEGAYPEFELPAVPGHPCLEFCTRYFTRAQQKQEQVPIPPTMAAGGVLQKTLSHKLHFTEDNIIGYKKKVMVREESGSYTQYQQCGPEIFHQGHIVEVHCSFTGVPTWAGKYQMIASFTNLVYLGDGCNMDLLMKAVSLKQSMGEEEGAPKQAR